MEWKTVNICDLCDTISVTYSRGADMVVLINTSDVLDGKFLNREKVPNKDLRGQFKKTFQKDDILYSEIRPANRRFAYVDFDAVDYIASTKLMVLRAKPNVNPRFLYHILKSDSTLEQLQALAESRSGTFPQITYSEMANVSVLLPDRLSQDKIVAILSSLDDKIENNNRINANLEAQAQALFKSWFVDFEPFGGVMPEDWKQISLDEMTSKFGTGLNPRQNFKLGEGENYYVTIKNMGNNRVYLDGKCDKVTDEAIEKINKRSKLQAGDLLFSGIGTIGRVALVTETPKNWNTSESVFNMHPAKTFSSEFLYVLLLSDLFQQYVKVFAQGGVQQGIRMASLKDFKIALPDAELRKKFDDLIIPIISKIKSNDKENDKLATLRDTLLPKLMKGEIAL